MSGHRQPQDGASPPWDDEATLLMDDRHVHAFDGTESTTDVRTRAELEADLDAAETTTSVTARDQLGGAVEDAPTDEARRPEPVEAPEEAPRRSWGVAVVAAAAVALVAWTAVVFAAGVIAGLLLS